MRKTMVDVPIGAGASTLSSFTREFALLPDRQIELLSQPKGLTKRHLPKP
jgi:hypothetical protein